MMPEIASEDLRLDQVPAADADTATLEGFALTFNGYKYWGSFDKCADLANDYAARFEKDQELAPTLTLLRTCLFFEQRRWRHFDEELDDKALDYWRAVVSAIRLKVENQQYT